MVAQSKLKNPRQNVTVRQEDGLMDLWGKIAQKDANGQNLQCTLKFSALRFLLDRPAEADNDQEQLFKARDTREYNVLLIGYAHDY
jgi:hypothetical protein